MPSVDNCVTETNGSYTGIEMSCRYYLRPPSPYSDKLFFTDVLRVTIDKQMFNEEITTTLDSDSDPETVRRARISEMGKAMMRIGDGIYKQAVHGKTDSIKTPTGTVELF